MRKVLIILSGIFMMATIIKCSEQQVDYLNENPMDKANRMQWWNEARFGMFIHWGLYAIPAGEWNGETNHAEWIRTTAQIPIETYDQFVEQFNPVDYDPVAWVKMAKDAGMKYIVITSKHHDGFCLFNSKYTDFDVMSTPYQKDILKKLADAAHDADIKICWYHSIMDWHHPDYLPRREWEKERTTEGADFNRYVAYMKNQLKELVDNYGDIGVLWFDGEWEGTWSNEYGKDLYNYVRNLDPDIIINNRVDVGRSGMEGMTRTGTYAGDFGTPEQEIPATGLPGVYWETCMTMNDHWGYNKHDNNWKSAKDLIRKLSDIASKGGNFLLNVGPMANGEFPPESINRLEAIGKWMKLNGEAIYGTKASPFKELSFGRCTQKEMGGNTRLYFHIFNWPINDTLRIPGIYNNPGNAYLLADQDQQPLEVKRDEDALLVALNRAFYDDDNSIVVLDIAGDPDISNPPVINVGHNMFIDSVKVNLTSDRENIQIHYTLDGSMPTDQSPIFDHPFSLHKSTLISARCFRNGQAVSDSIHQRVRQVVPEKASDPGELINGLKALYFEGDWDSVPDFKSLNPVDQTMIPNFSIASKKKDDYYAFELSGYILIDQAGVYDFFTDSDDGSILYINNTLVVDNDGLHGMELKKGSIPLGKGFHRITVGFFEKNGNDDLKVYFQGPGFDRMHIPDKILFSKK